jgi:hypothetical protein
MSTANNDIGGRVYLRVDLVFVIYLSFLIAFAVEGRPPYSWISVRGRYLYFWHPHAISLGSSDFMLFYAEILLLPAILIFACFRLIKRSSKAAALLLTLQGVVAFAGFPLVCLYLGPFYFAVVELALAVGCALLWAYQKWPVSAPINGFLLCLHYAFWFFFGVTEFGLVIRPWAWWGLWDYMLFVLPTLGFFYGLAWASHFRRSSDAVPSNRLFSL